MLRHLFNMCQYLNILALIMPFRHSQVRNTVVVVVVVVVLDFGNKNIGIDTNVIELFVFGYLMGDIQIVLFISDKTALS